MARVLKALDEIDGRIEACHKLAMASLEQQATQRAQAVARAATRQAVQARLHEIAQTEADRLESTVEEAEQQVEAMHSSGFGFCGTWTLAVAALAFAAIGEVVMAVRWLVWTCCRPFVWCCCRSSHAQPHEERENGEGRRRRQSRRSTRPRRGRDRE